MVLRAAGCGAVTSGLVALLPMVAPITGLEAINATGSGYMLLVFLAALAVCFPPTGRFPAAGYAVGALVVSLTIPSSVVLLLPLAVQTARRRVPARSAVAVGAMLVAGLAVQAVRSAHGQGPAERLHRAGLPACLGRCDSQRPAHLLARWRDPQRGRDADLGARAVLGPVRGRDRA